MKDVVYPAFVSLFVVFFVIYNVSDLAIQEQDWVFDSFIMCCCACMWLTQPPHLRKRDLPNILVIAGCLKVLYFVENEKGMNRQIEPGLIDARIWF